MPDQVRSTYVLPIRKLQTPPRLILASTALALTVLLTACSGGTDTATGSLVFEVDPGVDKDDEALIREVADDARKYYEKPLAEVPTSRQADQPDQGRSPDAWRAESVV